MKIELNKEETQILMDFLNQEIYMYSGWKEKPSRIILYKSIRDKMNKGESNVLL